MDDYDQRLFAWALRLYPDPSVASAAAAAAADAYRSGATQQAADVRAHLAAIASGGEYRLRPDRVGMAIVLSVLIALMFVPATLLGLTVNPSLGGYLFLAGSIIVPVAGVFGLIAVRRNSYLFVNKASIGRRTWRGRIAFQIPRSGASVQLNKGSWGETLFTDEGPSESRAIFASGRDIESTSLLWWSNQRFQQFAAIAQG